MNILAETNAGNDFPALDEGRVEVEMRTEDAMTVVVIRREPDGIRRTRRFQGIMSERELLDRMRSIVREGD